MKKNLIDTIKQTVKSHDQLPFSVYTSIKEQHLLNVPVVKPLFIAVLGGEKILGEQGEITCKAGDFIFLSDNPAINMRNIPKESDYFAFLLEFDYQDFHGLQNVKQGKKKHCVGEINEILFKCLQQFVEWSSWTPKDLWPVRRKEIIKLMCLMGHEEILTMVGSANISNQVHGMLSQPSFQELSMEVICDQLAMSESTLRRKLKSEGTSLQAIKDQVKLGLGLHLLQTTELPISLIAEECGYHSQSRFTDRFKSRFGLTPSQLRKTKMTD